jgi:hypothetical protein
MRQGARAHLMFGFIAALLLLLQQPGFAQDTIESAEVNVTAYDEVQDEEVTQEQPEEVLPEPVVLRSVPDSVIKRFQKQKEFAYANDPAYWVKEREDPEGENWEDWLARQDWFRYMILTVMILVLLFVVVKIALANKLFTRSSRKSGIAEEDELLNKDNLRELIQQAEAQNNFRLAVRYRYMKVLQDMDERKIIQLNAQSTNWDYVNRLGGHPLKKQFLLLTRAYEYVWYGEFEIGSDQYNYLRTEFQQFENSLSQ